MARQVVCTESELPVGEMKPFKVGDTKILVYHLDDGFYATQASCTHVFAPLGRGKIVDGCRIRCPLHHAEFEIRTGEVHTWANFPPGIQLLNGPCSRLHGLGFGKRGDPAHCSGGWFRVEFDSGGCRNESGFVLVLAGSRFRGGRCNRAFRLGRLVPPCRRRPPPCSKAGLFRTNLRAGRPGLGAVAARSRSPEQRWLRGLLLQRGHRIGE